MAPETKHRFLTANHVDALIKTTGDCPEFLGEYVTIPQPEPGSDDLGRHVLECHRLLAEVEGPNRAAFGEVADRLARELVVEHRPDRE
jgi:hypothetical protein